MVARRIFITVLLTLLLHNETITSVAVPTIYQYVHDFIQYNVAGIPLIHRSTEWNFDPDVGKRRRARYEQENGRFGELAIAKLGMGTENKGPWGEPVNN